MYSNQTWALKEGEGCTVTINVKQSNKPAFVVFDDTSFLGFEEDKYKVGKLITVREKTDPILNVTIYNAAQSDPINFLISFSSSYSIGVSGALLAIAAALLV